MNSLFSLIVGLPRAVFDRFISIFIDDVFSRFVTPLNNYAAARIGHLLELRSAGSNTNAGGIGSLEMLRNSSPQFRALLALVQSNPQILQPMLQELGKQNPQILCLIQENQAEFLHLINEAPEGAEEDLLGQLSAMPQTVPSAGSIANVGGIGSLEMLRNSSPQFRAFLALVQSSPQILQPMLQELGKQNPQIWRLIRENQAEFLRLINVAPEGAEGDLQGQLANAMPPTIEVTSEERKALERLEAMGFDLALVLEVFFACNKNEELATNYLLAHMHEFEDE